MTNRPPLPFSPATALAPLEGVGRASTLRAWASIGGMGLLCAPFVRVSSAGSGDGPSPPWRAKLMDELCQPLASGPAAPAQSVQLLGDDPARMARAAAALEARGVSLVDINFGCPSRTIVVKGAGAALLGDPARLAAIVRSVRDAVTVPVLAKLRLGREHPEEARELVAAAVEGGADLIAMHARTLRDGYRPPARWEWLARVVTAAPVPVIGNGDVWTAADARRMRAETGCAAVMIGRGALRNPWIFRQIEALERGEAPPRPTPTDVHALLRPLADTLLADAHDAVRARRKRGVPRLGPVKELVAHLGLLFDDGGAWRRATLRTRTAAALLAHIDALRDLRGVAAVDGPPRERPPSLP